MRLIIIKNVEKMHEMNFVLHQKCNIFFDFPALLSINQKNVLYTFVLDKKECNFNKRRCDYNKWECVRNGDLKILKIIDEKLFRECTSAI